MLCACVREWEYLKDLAILASLFPAPFATEFPAEEAYCGDGRRQILERHLEQISEALAAPSGPNVPTLAAEMNPIRSEEACLMRSKVAHVMSLFVLMLLAALPMRTLAEKGLYLAISPAKEIYRVGEPVIVTFTLSNETGRIIETFYDGSCGNPLFFFSIYDDEGALIATTLGCPPCECAPMKPQPVTFPMGETLLGNAIWNQTKILSCPFCSGEEPIVRQVPPGFYKLVGRTTVLTVDAAPVRIEIKEPEIKEPRRELYQVSTKLEHRAARGNAFSIPRSSLALRPDADYDLLATPFTSIDEPPPSRPLCADASFYGQPRLSAGATGILVGEDLVMTAWHAMQNPASCAGRAILFDHALALSTASEDANPVIPASHVFFCTTIVASGGGLDNDWSLMRLDRPVESDRVPLKVRRRGSLVPNSAALLVGHPHRLPLKLEQGSASGGPTAVYGSGHVTPGSSGSMVLGWGTGRVEGLVTTGSVDIVQDPELACYRECVASPPTCFGSFGGVSAARFAEAVPAIGIEVAPEGPSLHYGPPGGPFSDPRVEYTVEVGRAGAPVAVDAIPPMDGLLVIEPSWWPDLLPAGSSYTLAVRLADQRAAELDIGVHETSVIVADRTYATYDPRIHRVFVGVAGFDVQTGVGSGDGLAYAVGNRYLVSQLVDIAVDRAWLRLESGGQSLRLMLPPIHSEAPNSRVLTSLSPETRKPPAGSEGSVIFRSGGEGRSWHTVVRHVRWDGVRLVALD
ncbi:MAG: trypsin-like peptidase domain-containing protein [Acidobacteria bacterium]|nr:trypsin-like peptidase domain-containing protein [Acidobacteriota bacterium]